MESLFRQSSEVCEQLIRVELADVYLDAYLGKPREPSHDPLWLFAVMMFRHEKIVLWRALDVWMAITSDSLCTELTYKLLIDGDSSIALYKPGKGESAPRSRTKFILRTERALERFVRLCRVSLGREAPPVPERDFKEMDWIDGPFVRLPEPKDFYERTMLAVAARVALAESAGHYCPLAEQYLLHAVDIAAKRLGAGSDIVRSLLLTLAGSYARYEQYVENCIQTRLGRYRGPTVASLELIKSKRLEVLLLLNHSLDAAWLVRECDNLRPLVIANYVQLKDTYVSQLRQLEAIGTSRSSYLFYCAQLARTCLQLARLYRLAEDAAAAASEEANAQLLMEQLPEEQRKEVLDSKPPISFLPDSVRN